LTARGRHLDLDRIKTIFGDKKRPHYDKRKKNPTRWGVVVETPAYDVTIFKIHYGKMTLKIYSKGEHVLRIEVIVHNTREYRWGRSLRLSRNSRQAQGHSGKIPERCRLHQRLLQIGIRAAARRLPHQETPSQRNGPQDRKVTAIRTPSGGTALPHCPAGPAPEDHPPLTRRQHPAEAGRKTSPSNAGDHHYENLRIGMRSLFTELGIAA
jgi:hypothetical protein